MFYYWHSRECETRFETHKRHFVLNFKIGLPVSFEVVRSLSGSRRARHLSTTHRTQATIPLHTTEIKPEDDIPSCCWCLAHRRLFLVSRNRVPERGRNRDDSTRRTVFFKPAAIEAPSGEKIDGRNEWRGPSNGSAPTKWDLFLTSIIHFRSGRPHMYIYVYWRGNQQTTKHVGMLPARPWVAGGPGAWITWKIHVEICY